MFSRHKRIRGRRLQEYRARWFSVHPLCAECERNGKVRLATQLDHIVALTNGGTDFDQPGNRQGLCDDCHEVKSARDKGQRSARAIGLDGFPIERPADALHAG
jgi:5-methylcytosine-specific restriction protein A